MHTIITINKVDINFMRIFFFKSMDGFENKFKKLKEDLETRYKNENFKNEYVQLGLARLSIREGEYEKAQKILKEITCQDENVRKQVSELTKNSQRK